MVMDFDGRRDLESSLSRGEMSDEGVDHADGDRGDEDPLEPPDLRVRPLVELFLRPLAVHVSSSYLMKNGVMKMKLASATIAISQVANRPSPSTMWSKIFRWS